MKFYGKSNGHAGSIEILSPAPDCRFRIDGDAVSEAHVEMPEPGVFSILMNGRSYDASVEEALDGLVVTIDGCRFEVEVTDPRRWVRSQPGRGGEGVERVVAPMPGKIVRVLVAPGEQVAAGQGIAVVEAMKMQNEMKAARAGRIASVMVTEGATVAAGDVLATVG